MRGIVWFRRDLRLNDQPALTAACGECDEVIPLFVFDETLLQSHVFGSVCVSFMLGCLEDVAASLTNRGITLQWRRGESVEEVVQVAQGWKADAVYWNRDYEPGAIERDHAVQQRLAQIGVIVRTFKDHVVFEAEEVRSATGEPMQRYSAYRTRWWAKWQAVKPTILPIPRLLTAGKAASLPVPPPLPSADDLGYEHVTLWIEPGERSAQKRLRRFVEGPIHAYITGRNIPAFDGSSILSPHFRFGTLSAPRSSACGPGVTCTGQTRLSSRCLHLDRRISLAGIFSAGSVGFPSCRQRTISRDSGTSSTCAWHRTRSIVSGLVRGEERFSNRGRRDAATESDGLDA
jgi:deoxyribodipyrimidine photo-lyase